ncbi:MAG: hypothetical protein H7A18_07035 [Sinobacteraceae bacterium]|nr:hypothetical protein [Nevskiaceae bacterium]
MFLHLWLHDGVIGNRHPPHQGHLWPVGGLHERQLTTGDIDWFARANRTGQNCTDLHQRGWIGDNYLNLSWHPPAEAWSVAAFCASNVTDDDTLLAGTLGVDALSFGISSIPGNYQTNDLRFSAPIPRSYGLRFTYNF